jgi:hypothetical protein
MNGPAISMGRVRKIVQKPMKANVRSRLRNVPSPPIRINVHPRPDIFCFPKNCVEPQLGQRITSEVPPPNIA